MITRQQLQVSSETRLKGLKVWNENGELYDLVCQDCGYVLELALKSAVCKNINQDNYPENNEYYRTHNLNKLVTLSGLGNALEIKKKDFNFYANWSLLRKWSVEFRYMPIGTKKEANSLEVLNAIENEKDGVHPWVKENW